MKKALIGVALLAALGVALSAQAAWCPLCPLGARHALRQLPHGDLSAIRYLPDRRP